MRELTTIETFEITGRGTAHVVHVSDDVHDIPQVGEHVLLDGELCRIRGVEVHPTNPPRLSSNGCTSILIDKEVEGRQA